MREIRQPILRICKPFDFRTRYTDSFNDLKLIHRSCGFCDDLSLFCFGFINGDAVGWTVGRGGFCDAVELSLDHFESFKIGTEELYFAHDLVCRCLYPDRSAEMKIESTWKDLDRQACDMKAMGGQDPLAQEALISRGELDF